MLKQKGKILSEISDDDIRAAFAQLSETPSKADSSWSGYDSSGTPMSERSYGINKMLNILKYNRENNYPSATPEAENQMIKEYQNSWNTSASEKLKQEMLQDQLKDPLMNPLKKLLLRLQSITPRTTY